MKDIFALKGCVVYSQNITEVISKEKGYVICIDGKCKGVYDSLPSDLSDIRVIDCGNELIIPGMTDLHIHAPQYSFRGRGMNLELLEWLSTYTFPEESKYSDLVYARKAYEHFVNDLKRCFTTRAVIFATIHNEATLMLMRMLEESGMISYVGRVNMDRNGGDNLEEKDAQTSLRDTEKWLEECRSFTNTLPILTPRFIPSCTEELMKGIGRLAAEKELRLQSHLSENKSEIAWVRELVPEADCYAGAYELFNTMGSEQCPAIMAHCVYSDDREMEILKSHGTYVAHCASSNMNLSSGIAPVKKMLQKGIKVGLGTDVAAGSSMNMVDTMLITIQASKMYSRLIDESTPVLTFEEVFYLATMGGGSYFGKVGSFLEGYDFDAVVIDDSRMQTVDTLPAKDRVERMVYNNVDCVIKHKFVKGKEIER